MTVKTEPAKVAANAAQEGKGGNPGAGAAASSDSGDAGDGGDEYLPPDEPDGAPPAKAAPEKAVEKPAAKGEQKPAAKAADKGDGKPAARKSMVADAATKTTEGGAAKPAAPEKYELKGADGEPLDEQSTKAVESFARKLGLSNEAAQSYVNHEIERVNEQWAAHQEQIKADPEVGGERLQQSIALAARARGLFDADMQRMLDGPWGDNPVIFKNLVRLGKRLSPDTQARSSADDKPRAPTEKDELRDMYPEDYPVTT